jgi:hypothetical protein
MLSVRVHDIPTPHPPGGESFGVFTGRGRGTRKQGAAPSPLCAKADMMMMVAVSPRLIAVSQPSITSITVIPVNCHHFPADIQSFHGHWLQTWVKQLRTLRDRSSSVRTKAPHLSHSPPFVHMFRGFFDFSRALALGVQ